MLFVSKITPIFALLTFKEKELAHQAYSSAPCQLGGLFCFQAIYKKGEDHET